MNSTLSALQELIEIVAKLRSPDGGCPWDLAQTPESLTPYIIEEAYEAVDAIKSGQKKAIVDELGDLLLQVVLQAQIASDTNDFTLAEVAESISQKMIRRHPHVFGDVKVNSTEEVKKNWEEIKAAEIGETNDLLSKKLNRYARQLPPLLAAMKISKKAAAVGFEWENVDGVWEKFYEEVGEFQEALKSEDKEHQQAEMGDILFVVVQLARWYDLNPEQALQGTNHRFLKRFALLEAMCERPISEYTLAEFEQMWQKAKAKLSRE
ncbi:MAG: nucleoside triphosphate pyrophosphohydrolase [Okeania sp. SIO3I5]|uniref:nucleoside triphosphate pyrophosphohydrolase n=1 Tax=Okeania sp. SIO3I5 TaxID=2607805 RepID=UPI0013BE7BC1|nr:nucleoside triphosphate pyrophosphohydrolase [Okeania sp. SIO3I5]NEQ37959.1 nucleoside triphosphate pyrophosphohydrolase [Okeania sp. SIO3I5]